MGPTLSVSRLMNLVREFSGPTAEDRLRKLLVEQASTDTGTADFFGEVNRLGRDRADVGQSSEVIEVSYGLALVPSGNHVRASIGPIASTRYLGDEMLDAYLPKQRLATLCRSDLAIIVRY